MPWKTYKKRDITQQVRDGKNLVAIDVIRYRQERRRGVPGDARSPMSATIYVEMADGSARSFKAAASGWKAALDAEGNWQETNFDDSQWKDAIAFPPPAGSFDGPETGYPWPTGAVKSLRKSFEAPKKISSARLYATALGVYKLLINGKEVGDQVLSPGWTDYRERVAYQAYDVTGRLQPGKNAIGALLAPGWYSTPLQWYGQGNNYGKTLPALRAELRIAYADGSTESIPTDSSWKANTSAVSFAEIYDGETFDARKVQNGWNGAAFNDSAWKSVEVVHSIEPEIEWQYFPPIRKHEELQAKSVNEPKPGVYVFDFGQNLSGVARVRAKGPAGTEVKLRFAEVLNPDGTIYVENLRTAKATDHFILAGSGDDEYQPSFTYHGFRYAELSGVSNKPEIKDVQAVVFHTDAPFISRLTTGSAMLNQLWSNIQWGQRSNFVGVPTDCPQRDERLGWSADAQVFWRAASYNMNLTEFSKKYSADLRGTQIGTPMYGIFAPGTLTPNPGHGTGWSDAGVIVPWTGWIQYGSKRTIEQNWEGMEKYLAAIQADNPNFLWKKNYGIPFGDWLSPEGPTPEDLIATAYWAYDVTLMRQMAHAAGRTEDEQKYAGLFENIKEAFNKAYVRSDGFVGGVAPPPVFASGTSRKLSEQPVDTQTSYVLALYMKLLPNELRPVSAKRLIDKIA